MGVYGQRLYGKVDHVPGMFYVSTMFFHVNYVPLVPLGSYVVLDGSDGDDSFQGTRVGLRFKSILAGYLRGWLGGATIFLALVASFSTTAFLLGKDVPGGFFIILAVAGLVTGAFWLVLSSSRGWLVLVLQSMLLATSLAVWAGCNWMVEHDPARKAARAKEIRYFPTLLLANAAGVMFTMTRLLTPASRDRALELAAIVGIPAEAIEERYQMGQAAAMDARFDPLG